MRNVLTFAWFSGFLWCLTGCEQVADVGADPDISSEVNEYQYERVQVTRRDIRIAVEAAGTVEPVTTVEVKSKASGEILELPVDTGEVVPVGSLLARIDQRVLNNTLEQSRASLDVAKARLTNSESQLQRVRTLYENKSLSKAEWEKSVLENAEAKSDVVRSEIQVENAVIQLSDSEVRAPINGTIIERAVEQGTVISSPMGSVSGGTLLLTMADLSRVQVRMLVDEIDIGKIQPSVVAEVTVAAYESRPFQGRVIKVEPQAVTQQNVTMFPVLIDIDNTDGLLKPGMNADVEVKIAERANVLSIPYAALLTVSDSHTVGSVLGFSREDIIDLLERSKPNESQRNSAADSSSENQVLSDAQKRMQEIREKLQSGARPDAEEIAFMRKMRNQMGASDRKRTQRTSASTGQLGGNYVVFVVRGEEAFPVRVRTGITDLDYSEVISGLTESDEVLLLPSSGLVRAQQRFQDRMKGRMGIPGLNRRS